MRWALFLAVGITLCGCYDSRWGEAKRAQKNAAAHATPAELARDLPVQAPRELVGIGVRFRATPAYGMQVLDWKTRVRDQVADVNALLVPLGVRLEPIAFEPWVGAPEDDLHLALGALAKLDPATDQAIVVGLVGKLPTFTKRFHDLGRAEICGNHMVVRAMRDAEEDRAIDRNLDELSDAERDRLRKDRLRHRTNAVFLHEVGHLFGAIHEEPPSLMAPIYDPAVNGYGTSVAELLSFSVAKRPRAAGEGSLEPRGTAAWLRAVAAELEKSASSEREETRKNLLARADGLEKPAQKEAPSPEGAKAEPAAQVNLPEDAAALPAKERALYKEARALFAAGRAAAAHEKAGPLFKAFPKDPAVAELRCQAALGMNLAWSVVKAECGPLMP